MAVIKSAVLWVTVVVFIISIDLSVGFVPEVINGLKDGFDPFENVNVSTTCKSDTKLYFNQLNQKWKWPGKLHFNDWSFQSEYNREHFFIQ